MIKIKKYLKNLNALTQVIQWGELKHFVDQYPVADGCGQDKVVVLARHGVDAVLGCGGLLSKFAKKGSEIKIVCFNDGSRETASGHSDRGMVNKIERDTVASFEAINKSIVLSFWRFTDGDLSVNKTTTGLLKSLLEQSRPDIIFAPSFVSEENDQSIIIATLKHAVENLKQPFSFDLWQYDGKNPLFANKFISIKDTLHSKINALSQYENQLMTFDYPTAATNLALYRGGGEPAEAFFVTTNDQFELLYKALRLS